MIQFSDLTLIEAQGNFHETNEIMLADGVKKWMIRTSATIITPSVACNYVLNFWHDGVVYIMETDHPMIEGCPDDDIRELSKWRQDCGWAKLHVHRALLSDTRGFDFWLKMYRSGLIGSDKLQQHDDNEMKRLSQFAGDDTDGDN